MEIIGIEFDRTRFDSPAQCDIYMRNSGSSDLFNLVDRKSFKLKSGNAIFMSDEKRKVWGWYGQLWREKGFTSERLDSHVVALRGDPKRGYWDPSEVPTPLPATQEKRQKLELIRQRRDFKRREAADKLKEKRKKEGKKKRAEPEAKDSRPLKPKKTKKTKAEIIAKAATAQPIVPIFNGLLPTEEDTLDNPPPSIKERLIELDDFAGVERPGHPNPLLDSNLA